MLIPSLEQAHGYAAIVVAPHLDDAALSCGGTIAGLRDAHVAVLAVVLCAGSPPADAELTPFARYLHDAWALGDDPIARRRAEDAAALEILGCDGLHLDLLDAPYRVSAYGEGDAWRGAVAADDPLIHDAERVLAQLYAQNPAARIWAPLGVGHHVDHQVVCAAGRRLFDRGADVRWYEDAPYAAKNPRALPDRLAELGWTVAPELTPIDAALERKLRAIDAYRSQIVELFGAADPHAIMTGYAAQVGAPIGWAAERSWRLAHPPRS